MTHSVTKCVKWPCQVSDIDPSDPKTYTLSTQEHDYSQTQVACSQVPWTFLDPFTLIWESPAEVLRPGLTSKHKAFYFRQYTTNLSPSKHHVSQRFRWHQRRALSRVPGAVKQFWSRVECLRPIINMKVKRMFSSVLLQFWKSFWLSIISISALFLVKG